MTDGKRPWFGPKTIGIGYSPKTWQGWATTGVFAVVMIATPFLVRRYSGGGEDEAITAILLLAFVEVVAFLAFAAWKSRTPKG